MNMTALTLWLDAVGYQLFHYLAAVLWQGTIVIAAGAMLVWLLRRRSASVRHAILAGAVLVLPLIPLLGTLLVVLDAPRAPVPVIPTYTVLIQNEPFIAESPALPTSLPANELIPSPHVPERRPFRPWAVLFVAYTAGALAFLGIVVTGRLADSGLGAQRRFSGCWPRRRSLR